MTEPFIHDSTPKSSPILAYGESASRDRRFWLFLALPLFLIVFVIGAGCWSLTRTRLPLPISRIALVFVRPNTPLPPEAPSLWKDAQRSARLFPIFVGLARNEHNHIYPFAITLRIFNDASVQRSGIWRLLTEQEEVSSTLEFIRPGELVTSWKDYAAPAWLRIWPSRLTDTHLFSSSSTSIGGPIEHQRWRTDVILSTLPSEKDSYAPKKDFNSLNIARLPEAWPVFQQILQSFGIPLDLKTIPQAIAWSKNLKTDSLDFALTFNGPLETDTKVHVLAAAGIFDHFLVTLPDQSLMTENRLPFETLKNSTSSQWDLKNERILIFKENEAFLGDASSSLRTDDHIPACQGQLLGTLNRQTVNQIGIALELADTLSMNQLVLAEEKGRLAICW